MVEVIKWSGHGGISFFCKKREIRGFRDLSISVSAGTEEKTVDGEKYTAKKDSGGYQITMTALLNAMLGVNVQAVAIAIADAARIGDTGYFYIGGGKLFQCPFMMTEAKIENIVLLPRGKWVSCEVAMTLKQAGKYDGTTGGSGSGSGSSKKKSAKRTGTGTTTDTEKKPTTSTRKKVAVQTARETRTEARKTAWKSTWTIGSWFASIPRTQTRTIMTR